MLSCCITSNGDYRGRSVFLPDALKLGSQLQLRMSSLNPTQSSPPFIGAGLLQYRRRVCSPSPHGSEQSPHCVHGPHPPSIASAMRERNAMRSHTLANNPDRNSKSIVYPIIPDETFYSCSKILMYMLNIILKTTATAIRRSYFQQYVCKCRLQFVALTGYSTERSLPPEWARARIAVDAILTRGAVLTCIADTIVQICK